MALANLAKAEEDSAAFFFVELFCTESKLTSNRTVSFASLPETVLQVKEKIEDQFSIPVCVQRLSYEANILSDEAILEQLKIRSGDRFVVKYSSEGDCKGIDEIVEWFAIVQVYLRAEDPSLAHPLSTIFEDVLLLGIDRELIEKLAFEYLFPWLDARKYANKLHFVHCGGLNLVMDIYEAILAHPWESCLLKLKYMEYGILRILWNLSETFELRRQILQKDNKGLRLCIKSLLRQKLTEGEEIQDQTDVASHRTNSWVLVENIGAALGLLCNLSELPECHIQVAHDEACLDQLTCLSLCPSVRTLSLQLVATLFLCVAYNPLTHPFLAKPVLIGRLLTACKKENGEDAQATLMLRYFTQVFLAQIVLTSPQCIPEEFKQDIQDFMESFLSTATYQALMEGEVKHWYVWSTFLPYIRVLYLPDVSMLVGDAVLRQLYLLSVRTMLLSLQNMLGRDNHRQVLLNEGLEDYITCVPAYVPVSLKQQAEELVQIVRSGIQLQPPKLLNLVRAKLAKTHFGLQKMLTMSVGEIVTATLVAS